MTFEQVLDRADIFGQDRPMLDRLVSIVFANPTSPVWADLHGNRAFLDMRSGECWDLFFAGLSGFAPMPRGDRGIRLDPSHTRRNEFVGYFNPEYFQQIEAEVEAGHRLALEHAEAMDRQPWCYRGGTNLVSFMVYGREPDWLSLKDVLLYDGDGVATRATLLHIVEGLAQWQEDVIEPQLAPGEPMHGVSRDGALLTAALGWSASAVAGGVLGDAAFELLKQLLQ